MCQPASSQLSLSCSLIPTHVHANAQRCVHTCSQGQCHFSLSLSFFAAIRSTVTFRASSVLGRARESGGCGVHQSGRQRMLGRGLLPVERSLSLAPVLMTTCCQTEFGGISSVTGGETFGDDHFLPSVILREAATGFGPDLRHVWGKEEGTQGSPSFSTPLSQCRAAPPPPHAHTHHSCLLLWKESFCWHCSFLGKYLQ